MTHEQAIGQLLSFAGTQFDPRIVQVFAGLPRPNLAGPANLLDDREALAQLESVVAG
jgi:HD-GYP domain-containing protein (c-di-GMP phosphodiesterase class II)